MNHTPPPSLTEASLLLAGFKSCARGSLTNIKFTVMAAGSAERFSTFLATQLSWRDGALGGASLLQCFFVFGVMPHLLPTSTLRFCDVLGILAPRLPICLELAASSVLGLITLTILLGPRTRCWYMQHGRSGMVAASRLIPNALGAVYVAVHPACRTPMPASLAAAVLGTAACGAAYASLLVLASASALLQLLAVVRLGGSLRCVRLLQLQCTSV